MIVLYALCAAVVSVSRCFAITDDEIVLQLTSLTEKYDLLDKKVELLTEENAILKTRVDELSKENLDIKSQLKLTEEPDEMVNHITSTNDSPWNESTRYTAQQNHDVESLPERTEMYADQSDSDATSQGSKEAKQRGSKANTTNKQRRLLLSPNTTTIASTTKVAFTAVLTKSLPLGLHQVVEYDKVITNVGHAYDPRHGHFIAPTKAVYLMACTVMNGKGGLVYIQLVKNGTPIGHLYGDSSDYNMGTQVSIVVLEKGDMVWVRHGGENRGSETLHTGEYNTFSGTTLFEMESV